MVSDRAETHSSPRPSRLCGFFPALLACIETVKTIVDTADAPCPQQHQIGKGAGNRLASGAVVATANGDRPRSDLKSSFQLAGSRF